MSLSPAFRLPAFVHIEQNKLVFEIAESGLRVLEMQLPEGIAKGCVIVIDDHDGNKAELDPTVRYKALMRPCGEGKMEPDVTSFVPMEEWSAT